MREAPCRLLDVPHLRTVRQRRLMSQRELAEAAHVSKPTIIGLELGRQPARYGTIRSLAHALGVEPSELLRSGPGSSGEIFPGEPASPSEDPPSLSGQKIPPDE